MPSHCSRRSFVVGICGSLFPAIAVAQETPSNSHPVLVELFTAEGCSSCPPADEFLGKLDSLQPIHGAQLIVLSEHVDYWDRLGWKDPNSSAAFTDRQTAYERVFKKDAPYTPQIIVDGTSEAVLANLQQFQTILEHAATTPKIPIRIGEPTLSADKAGRLDVHIECDANPEKHDADVYVAVALNRVESEVLRGENKGRHLTHVAVVQQLTKVGKLPKGQSFSRDVELKLKPETNPKGIRLIVFIQESGPGKVLGAALRKPTS